MKTRTRTPLAVILVAGAFWCSHRLSATEELPIPTHSDVRHLVTRVAQFRNLSGADYLDACDFRLVGVVTLVDTSRDLMVLQDASGAVALNFSMAKMRLQAGRRVILEGTNCCPLVMRFPDYPYRPSGWDVRASFESPLDQGEFHLTRMRAFLHPPVTGNYRFWIASDNSSELWLSIDASPAKVRKMASVVRFDWTAPRQWSKYSSQRSEPIQLEAGRSYYIEALQEQTVGNEHLSVAWLIPSRNESSIEVIDRHHLTPWTGGLGATITATNGILREYWTNFAAANIANMAGPRPFESALSVERVSVQDLGPGEWPEPIALGPPSPTNINYRWVRTEGMIKFSATDQGSALLELLTDRGTQVQVRTSEWQPEMLPQSGNAILGVEGVCEMVSDQQGERFPGVIWAASPDCITVIETLANASPGTKTPEPSTTAATRTMQGYYGTMGLVTFNDCVFGEELIFVQEDAGTMQVRPRNDLIRSELKVGRRVEMGGALESGGLLPLISPMFVENFGRRSMPPPLVQPLGAFSNDREGQWSQLEGIVHAVNSNGTLHVECMGGPAHLWVGQSLPNDLARYVDARLRVRGVLMMNLQDTPLLLVPSRSFVEVEEAAPKHPFSIPVCPITDLLSDDMEFWRSHRVQVVGEVTYRHENSFFVQDASGGIRVSSRSQQLPRIGESVEVVAFPVLNGFVHRLTKPLVRPASAGDSIRPKELNLSEPLASIDGAQLVQVNATLLAQRTNTVGLVLDLQDQQRVFMATLAPNAGPLQTMRPGSLLRITGVCDDATFVAPQEGDKSARAPLLASLNILLRTPQDVVVLSGPPWWTWRRTAGLVGTLLTVLVVTLLWVHLLHRNLERQNADRLAFSRQLLERLEDERKRIAANLHDSLGQTLLVIKNHATLANQSAPGDVSPRRRLDEISGTASQAIEEVRRITHGLRPYQLDRLGLTQAIRTSVNRAAEDKSIEIASRVENIDGVFSKEAEIHVYRIVQEAITNVVKHSAATEAAVVIKRRTADLTLSIRDNGRGFDATGVSSQRYDLGYGLTGMAERVRILGGTFDIDSRPGAGTSLTIEVPFQTTIA